MARGTTTAPPALTHGLTSRWLFAGLQGEVDELADVLVGSSPRLPGILEAARRAAEAILRLRQVRTMKTHTLNHAEPGADLGESGAATRGGGADAAMLRLLEQEERILRRLDDYERRALSRRARAIRELDLARIEADRRGLSRSGAATVMGSQANCDIVHPPGFRFRCCE